MKDPLQAGSVARVDALKGSKHAQPIKCAGASALKPRQNRTVSIMF